MPRHFPYSVKSKYIELEGHYIMIHVTDDLTVSELNHHFVTAYHMEDWDHMRSLAAEFQFRGLELPDIFGIKKEGQNGK